MNSGENLEMVMDLVIKDLALSDEEAEGLMIADESKLFHNLQLIIKYLLNHDFNRLINACYRLDVQQERFQKALNAPDPDQIPEAIATLVLDREREKLKWRMKYSSQ